MLSAGGFPAGGFSVAGKSGNGENADFHHKNATATSSPGFISPSQAHVGDVWGNEPRLRVPGGSRVEKPTRRHTWRIEGKEYFS